MDINLLLIEPINRTEGTVATITNSSVGECSQ